MSRKRIIICVGIFATLEILLVAVAFWPKSVAGDASPFVLRIGVIPEISRDYSETQWNSFCERLRTRFDFHLEPYYARSYEEAFTGLENGTLDFLYLNPVAFAELQERCGYAEKLRNGLKFWRVEPFWIRRYSEDQKGQSHAVLATLKDIRFITRTKGMRLTFANRHSMTGYIVPYKYLNIKFPDSLNKWFAGVGFAGTKGKAVVDLFEGRTDIIAIDHMTLKEAVRLNNYDGSNVRVLWDSGELPQPLVCYNNDNKLLDMKQLQTVRIGLSNMIMDEESIKGLSMLFIAPGFNYSDKLEKLKQYLNIGSNFMREKAGADSDQK